MNTTKNPNARTVIVRAASAVFACEPLDPRQHFAATPVGSGDGDFEVRQVVWEGAPTKVAAG